MGERGKETGTGDCIGWQMLPDDAAHSHTPQTCSVAGEWISPHMGDRRFMLPVNSLV